MAKRTRSRCYRITVTTSANTGAVVQKHSFNTTGLTATPSIQGGFVSGDRAIGRFLRTSAYVEFDTPVEPCAGSGQLTPVSITIAGGAVTQTHTLLSGDITLFRRATIRLGGPYPCLFTQDLDASGLYSPELSHKKGSWQHCHLQDHHSLAAALFATTTFSRRLPGAATIESGEIYH